MECLCQSLEASGGDDVTTPGDSSAMASMKVAVMLAMLCATLAVWIMHYKHT